MLVNGGQGRVVDTLTCIILLFNGRLSMRMLIWCRCEFCCCNSFNIWLRIQGLCLCTGDRRLMFGGSCCAIGAEVRVQVVNLGSRCWPMLRSACKWRNASAKIVELCA